MDSLPSSKGMNIGQKIISRMLKFNTSWKYNQFNVFKKFNRDGTPQHREFLFGSPTTCLCEAVLLQLLSKETAFKVHPCAYSYQWPVHNRSGRNHSFFLEGYKDRNNKITQLLKKYPNKVALITDIKKFYPSVQKDVLRNKIQKRLAYIDNQQLKEILSRFVNDLLDHSPSGIPVGPDMGHLLGHIALEDIDCNMYDMFGEHYTRYVDDIIVVCESAEIEKVKSHLIESLDEMGLRLNSEKTDIVKSRDWLKSCPRIQNNTTEDSFEGLVKDILIYLNRQPDKETLLCQEFKKEGFSLPFRRLVALSKYKRLTHYLRPFLTFFGPNEKTIIEKAKRVRGIYLQNLKEEYKKGIAERITHRRWHVQKLRYTINRLFYLLNFSEYGILLELTPDIDEFVETREVIKSIINRDITGLLQMPGRSVAAFCELWAEFIDEAPTYKIPEWSDGALDSIAALAYYGVSEIHEGIYEGTSPEVQALLKFCNGTRPSTREFTSLSYVDELRSLQLNYTKEDLSNFLTTRYNDEEEFSLAVLRLGETSFS